MRSRVEDSWAFGNYSKPGRKDWSFYTEACEPVYVHLMEIQQPDFTRLKTKGMYVNRLMFFRSRHRVKVRNNVLGIQFVGKPIKSFSEGTLMRDVVLWYFKPTDLVPFEGDDINEFYSELIVDHLVEAGWKIRNVEDVRDICSRSWFSVDLKKEVKFNILINVLRLKKGGMISG